MSQKSHGRYKLQFTGGKDSSELTKKTTDVQMHAQLNTVSSLRVSFVHPGKSFSEWKTSSMPKEASLHWQDRLIFEGETVSFESHGLAKTTVIFHDPLSHTKKFADDGVVQNEQLSDCLKKLTKRCALSMEMIGPFTDKIAAFYFGGRTVLENLQLLADQYGFHFIFRPSTKKLTFIRVGHHIAKAKLSDAKSVTMIDSVLSVEQSYSEIHFRIFDSGSMASKDRKFSKQQFYQPLQSMTEHSSYREKSGWKTAAGTLEVHTTSMHEFETAEHRISHQLSKHLLEQDALRLQLINPLCLPGDQLEVEKSPRKEMDHGNYLSFSCHVDIASNLPRMNVVAVRP